jgi:hypothetical protein
MANKEGRDRISESRRSKESMRKKGSGRERSRYQRKDLGLLRRIDVHMRVCLFSVGHWPMICLMSFSKPLSSIRSASSRTR